MLFINTTGAILRAICTAWLSYLLGSSLYISRKKDILMPFYVLLIFFICLSYNLFEFDNIYLFWSYPFQMIFYILTWKWIIEHFVEGKEEKLSKKNITLYSLTGIILGTTSFYLNIVSFFTVIFSTIFALVLKRKKENMLAQNIIKFGKNLHIPILFFFLSFAITYLNPIPWKISYAFKQVEATFEFFKGILFSIPEFLNTYLNHIILHFVPVFLCIILLIIAVYFLTPDKEKFKRLLFIISTIALSIFLFYFSLIIVGKTFYEQGKFWLNHQSVYNLYKITLLFLTLCLFSYLINLINNSKKSKIIANISLILILSIMLINDNKLIDTINYTFKEQPSISKNNRQAIYLIDKLCIFYYLKDEPAKLPINSVLNMWTRILIFPFKDLIEIYGDEPSVEKKYNEFLEYTNQLIENRTVIKDSIYLNTYLKQVYGINYDKGYILMSDDDAMDEFKKEGGIINSKEIEKGNFQKLLKYSKNKVYEQ